MKKIYIVILVVAAGAVIYMLLPQVTNAPTKTIQPTVVGNALVPTTGDITLSAGQPGTVGDLRIVWNEPLQDSRCPVGTQCIWAGEVKVNVTMTLAEYSETKVISSNKPPYLFDGHKVSIIGVTPQAKQGTQLGAGDYQITFHIEATNEKK